MAIPNYSPGPETSRRETRRLLRREGILDVAERSFLEDGYAGTTMSEIAARLGGSKGTLWGYFPSKEALFTAVLDRATEQFREQLTGILNPRDPVEVALTRFCRGLLQRVCSPNAVALYRLVTGEAERFPEIGRIFYERAPGQTRRLLVDYLRTAMAYGRLAADDADEAAQALIALCLSGNHHQVLFGAAQTIDPAGLEADAARAVALFGRLYRF